LALFFLGGCGVTLAFADDGTNSFDPAKAFCQRQTFVLENINEVFPWLDYFSGLRNGRSPAPDHTVCASSTIRGILSIVGSGDLEMAKDRRSAFFWFYIGRAMEPELADRRIDTDGTFRYRNDIVLAGFIWFLCPGHKDQRYECVKENIGSFPDAFLKTSPVFCDFTESALADVEWPPNRDALPLVCNGGDSQISLRQNAWIRRAEIALGE
jgi:hypothetical protein